MTSNCRTALAGPLLATAVLLASLSSAAAQTRVSFVEPRHNSVAIGSTPIEVNVETPSGARIRSVEIRVDDKTLVELSQPPWTTVWDAGDGSRYHRLAAVVTLDDGTVTQANIRTAALRINQVEEVGLVALYPIVRRSGNYVSDLTRDDFEILENGVPQRITRFSTERKPLRIGIVLDSSQSMENGERIEDARSAALDFLNVLEEGDEGMVVTFADSVHVAQPLTDDRELLSEAIQSVSARGGTALYDAIWRTSKRLASFEGRRVLVLLSDGKDESYDGLGPGSLHTLDEALDQALRSEVMVFAIGLGRKFKNKAVTDRDGRFTLKEMLELLADTTGGRSLITPKSGQLRKAFREVGEDLRNQYSMAYSSSNPEQDGSWRAIKVTVPDREAEVVSRKGYFATQSDTTR